MLERILMVRMRLVYKVWRELYSVTQSASDSDNSGVNESESKHKRNREAQKRIEENARNFQAAMKTRPEAAATSMLMMKN